MRRIGGQMAGYVAVALASFVLATVAGWLGTQIDNDAYDWMFRRHGAPGAKAHAILLVADDRSLNELGGMRHLRRALAEGLERVAAAGPNVVAIDLILPDQSDPEDDAALEAALQKIPRLVLAADLIENGPSWEDPLPRFRRWAAAVGHVHGDPGPLDGVSRVVPLAKVGGHDRRWALALEACRLSHRAGYILESPDDLEVGALRIPARNADSRMMRIRYLPPDENGASRMPSVSLAELKHDPSLAARFQGKVVFVGVTAQSAMRDRMLTPYSYGSYRSGIEIHANVFETLEGGRFLVSAGNLEVALFTLLLASAAVAAFALRTGWQAYALAGLVLAAAHLLPYWFFTRNVVYPYLAPVSAAWLAAVGAGSFQFVAVRRQLGRTEAEKSRYQQAMHFVTHEMRTPLTAIQGSSELMTRYKLPEEKRQQIAELINSESKRLARMIETFLSVERLSAGQIELKREPFPLRQLVETCVGRAAPLAEAKRIRIQTEPLPEAVLSGDRELMEYALYNLLTNAVKYSQAETLVTVSAQPAGVGLRLAVRDQGIGMDAEELKNIFQRFYRTRRAVASGERGTGIGLSIVEQIVAHHGGKIEVASAPGRGSCFTLVLPARVPSGHGAGAK